MNLCIAEVSNKTENVHAVHSALTTTANSSHFDDFPLIYMKAYNYRTRAFFIDIIITAFQKLTLLSSDLLDIILETISIE